MREYKQTNTHLNDISAKITIFTLCTVPCTSTVVTTAIQTTLRLHVAH